MSRVHDVGEGGVCPGAASLPRQLMLVLERGWAPDIEAEPGMRGGGRGDRHRATGAPRAP